MMPLRVVIVDDEPLALRRLKVLLDDMPDVQLVGAASSCAEAADVIEASSPDVLLLDIRMRDGTGFDVIEDRREADHPFVIFVTAFDHYAVRAFEQAAIDYLLKPIDVGRLEQALARVRSRYEEEERDGSRIEEMREVIENLRAALHDQQNDTESGDIWVRSANGSFTRVLLSDVHWISSEDDYVRLHLDKTTHLVRSSIRAIETKLEDGQFVRVHRSALVRLASIAEVRRSPSGRREVILENGEKIAAGRVNFRSLRELFRRNDLLSDS